MKITPLDIKKQEFRKIMRGFDPVEVETFLEMVAEEYESLIKERNYLSDEVIKLKTQLKDYQEVEKTFKESLMSAQHTINQSRENSQREANLIIKEAELQADKILEHTKIQLIEMKNQLMLIKSQKDSFAKRLRHLLESQLELIGVLEIDDLCLGEVDKSPDIGKNLITKPLLKTVSDSDIKIQKELDDKEKKNDSLNSPVTDSELKKKLSDQFIT